MTQVNQGPRLELLRGLAALRDWEATHEEADDAGWVTHYPLFGAGEWEHSAEDMLLACKEAAALGHIESEDPGEHCRDIYGRMIRLTDAGYDWIKAHDAIGEAEQEALRVRA